MQQSSQLAQKHPLATMTVSNSHFMTQGKAALARLILQDAYKLLVFALTWNTIACIILWEINSAALLRVHIIIMESYTLIV